MKMPLHEAAIFWFFVAVFKIIHTLFGFTATQKFMIFIVTRIDPDGFFEFTSEDLYRGHAIVYFPKNRMFHQQYFEKGWYAMSPFYPYPTTDKPFATEKACKEHLHAQAVMFAEEKKTENT